MGYQWTAAQLRWAKDRPVRCYSLFHHEFESLHDNDIIWAPWSPDFVDTVAPHRLSVQCTQDIGLWVRTCNLVFVHMVEPYAAHNATVRFVPARAPSQQQDPTASRPLNADNRGWADMLRTGKQSNISRLRLGRKRRTSRSCRSSDHTMYGHTISTSSGMYHGRAPNSHVLHQSARSR